MSNKPKSNIDQFNVNLATEMPDWLHSHEPDISDDIVIESQEGVKYLLWETQHYIQEDRVSRYFRTIMQLINMSAVEVNSKIFIEFDSENCQLDVHDICVYRGGVVYKKLHGADMQVLHREYQAESNVFNGNLTLLILLEDIKPGDILDIKYTRITTNKFNAENYNQFIYSQYSIHLHQYFNSILWDQNVKLTYKIEGDFSGVKNQLINNRNNLSVLIDKPNQYSYPKFQPVWYSKETYLQICSAMSWGDISKIMMRLYNPAQITNNELLNLLSVHDPLNSDVEKIIADILEYIRGNVRYLANYKATDSIIPSDPNAVCERKYGDCKDFTYLICSALSMLGIESSIVLVNSNLGKALNKYLPAMGLFDHVILRVYARGRFYYIDPTIRQNALKLDSLYLPNFGYGLVCDGLSEELVEIDNKLDNDVLIVEDNYQITSWSKNELSFSMKMTCSGSYALIVLNYLEKVKESDILETLKNAYSKVLSIKNVSKFEIDKSMLADGLVTINLSCEASAKYITTLDEHEKIETVMIDPLELCNFNLPPPEIVDSDYYYGRKMKLKYTINLSDGGKRNIADFEDAVSNDAFTYSRKMSSSNNILTYHHNYQKISDVVKKDAYQQIYDDHSKLIDLQVAIFNKKTKNSLSSRYMSTIIIFLAISIFGGFRQNTESPHVDSAVPIESSHAISLDTQSWINKSFQDSKNKESERELERLAKYE